MGQVLQGSATTTAAVPRAISHSQASLRALAKRYGIDPKTVAELSVRRATFELAVAIMFFGFPGEAQPLPPPPPRP